MFWVVISLCIILSLNVKVSYQHSNYSSVIYVDPNGGSLNRSCWTGGLDLPCRTYSLAEEGAQHFPKSVVALIHNLPSRLKLGGDREGAVCPTWMYPEAINNNTETCVCGPSVQGMVHCNKTLNEVAILDCHCLTTMYDDDGLNDTNSTVEVISAPCFYGCLFNTTQN